MSFGYEAAARISDRTKPTAIIYATRYGATRDTVVWVRKGMDMPVDLLDIERISFQDVLSGYDRIIVGSGIWIKGVHQRVPEFFQAGREALREKLLGTFIVCGSADGSEKGKERIGHYLDNMHAPLLVKPALTGAFGGRLVVDRLSEEDRTKLAAFYKNFLNEELRDWDLTDPGKAKRFGRKAKQLEAGPALQPA
ncbi:MAG: hypothetical protein HGB20_08920 [Chlorobiaceae bacterium]|nr:hypothetical protein [Chlorobiaceae bacterium]